MLKENVMRTVILIGVILLLPWAVAVGKVYKWVDRQGAIHFTDNPLAIPDMYHDQKNVPVTPPKRVARGVVVPLQRVGGAMVVEATLNKVVRVPLVVDTGSSFTVISTQAARWLGINLNQAEVIPVQSVSGTFLARFMKIKSLSVGGALVKDVNAIVHDTSSGKSMGLLGMSFLDNFQVTISAANKTMRLAPLSQGARTH